jgi:hypothetical protein
MHLPRAYNRKKGWKKRWEKKRQLASLKVWKVPPCCEDIL